MNERTFNYLKKCPSLPCPSGSRFKEKHVIENDGNNYSLKKVGQIDTYEQIQSYEDGVSLARMIERYKRGDTSALSRGSGFYADVSGFSDNPAEVINNTRGLAADAAARAAQVDAPSVDDAANKDESEVTSNA